VKAKLRLPSEQEGGIVGIRSQIVTSRNFDGSQRREAEDLRLDIELELYRKGIEHEVVLLKAANEDAVRRTHRRYFESLTEILRSSGG
jgi:hypothetical protein